MRKIADGSDRRRKGSQGFSMVEALVAISILMVGVLSLAQLIPSATKTDLRSRTDSTAVFIAMRELEQMLARPFNTGDIFRDATDGNGVFVTVKLTGAPPPNGAGAPLLNGNIDWTVPAVAYYSRNYTIVQPSGSTITVNGGTYEVRWNVTLNADNVRTIVIGVRPTVGLQRMIPFPANLRVVQMK